MDDQVRAATDRLRSLLFSLKLGACGHRGSTVHSTAAPTTSASPSSVAPAVAGSVTPPRKHRAYSDQNPRPQRAGDFVVA